MRVCGVIRLKPERALSAIIKIIDSKSYSKLILISSPFCVSLIRLSRDAHGRDGEERKRSRVAASWHLRDRNGDTRWWSTNWVYKKELMWNQIDLFKRDSDAFFKYMAEVWEACAHRLKGKKHQPNAYL